MSNSPLIHHWHWTEMLLTVDGNIAIEVLAKCQPGATDDLATWLTWHLSIGQYNDWHSVEISTNSIGWHLANRCLKYTNFWTR